jgi:hypothetical protein
MTGPTDIMRMMHMDMLEARIRRKEDRERCKEEREERRASQQMFMNLFMMQMGGATFKPKTLVDVETTAMATMVLTLAPPLLPLDAADWGSRLHVEKDELEKSKRRRVE